MKTGALVCCVAWLGCAATPHEPAPLGLLAAPGYISPAVESKAVDFRGTCSWGRPPGDAERYRLQLRARNNPSGTIMVWFSAYFEVTETSNALGALPSGTPALGDGPIYDSATQRHGYAIIVRGYDGRVCRGYVSAASVEVKSPRPRSQPGPSGT
ncbi:MAG: hypothetical protein AAGC55_00920 [Myxococcota bacterium]